MSAFEPAKCCCAGQGPPWCDDGYMGAAGDTIDPGLDTEAAVEKCDCGIAVVNAAPRFNTDDYHDYPLAGVDAFSPAAAITDLLTPCHALATDAGTGVFAQQQYALVYSSSLNNLQAACFVGAPYLTLTQFQTWLTGRVNLDVPWYDAAQGSPLPAGCANSTGWAHDKRPSFTTDLAHIPIIWTELGGNTVATVQVGAFYAQRCGYVQCLQQLAAGYQELFAIVPPGYCDADAGGWNGWRTPYPCPTDIPDPPWECVADTPAEIFAQWWNFARHGLSWNAACPAFGAAGYPTLTATFKVVFTYQWVFPGTYASLAAFKTALATMNLATVPCTVTYEWPAGQSFGGSVAQIEGWAAPCDIAIRGGSYSRQVDYSGGTGTVHVWQSTIFDIVAERYGFSPVGNPAIYCDGQNPAQRSVSYAPRITLSL